MDWRDQGRQFHMWFGHGTAAGKDVGDDEAADGAVAAATLGQRIDAIGYGAAGHLSADERRHYAIASAGATPAGCAPR